MDRYLLRIVTLVIVLSMARPVGSLRPPHYAEVAESSAAFSALNSLSASASATRPAETGVYTEDFTTYTAKDYTENAEWDIWAHALRLSRIDNIDQYSPAVAMDGSGNALLVWKDTGGSNCGIYAQKLDPNGNRLWAADVRVNEDITRFSRWHYSPAVALDEYGNIFIVWEDTRNNDLEDIYAQKLDTNGSKLWVADVKVNSVSWDSSGATSWYSPDVAVDGDGNVVVVWHDYRSGEHYDVYAQKLGPDGNHLWVNEVRVNSDGGTTDQEDPVVVVDSTGRALIAWIGVGDIYAQRLDANGNKLWGSDLRVNSGDGTWNGALDMAIDNSDNIFVVWDSSELYAQKLDVNGNKLWVNDLRISASTYTYGNPSLTASRDGSVLFVWRDYREDYYGDIYAQKLDGNGLKQWVSDVRVNSDSGVAPHVLNAVAADSDGNIVVLWEDMRNGLFFGGYDIYAQKLDPDGSKLWAGDIRINPGTGVADQGSPAVAVDENGNAVVVWEDRRNRNWDIYALRLDASGNKSWAGYMRVNSDSGTANPTDPAVAVDGNGNAIVVWKDYRNGNYDIYAQCLDVNGNKLWAADVRVNSDSGTASQETPAVEVGGSGSIIVVWGDNRRSDDNGDVYAQRLSADGNRLWAADVRANSDIGTAGQGFPSATVDGNGNIVVVWEDWRNGNGDIYGQRLGANGSKLWTVDVRVNSDSGAGSQTAPSIAVDGIGNVITIWFDSTGL